MALLVWLLLITRKIGKLVCISFSDRACQTYSTYRFNCNTAYANLGVQQGKKKRDTCFQKGKGNSLYHNKHKTHNFHTNSPFVISACCLCVSFNYTCTCCCTIWSMT